MIEKPEELYLPFPIITPRLKIFPAAVEHVEEMYRAKLDSMEQLKEWMTWAQSPPDLEADRELVIKKQDDFKTRKDIWLIAFTHDMRMVVATGFHNLAWKVPRCDIGYWCRTPDQGNGYVTESTNAMTRYAFDIMKMRKVNIFMDAENAASENVAKRLNFKHEFDDVGGTLKPSCTDLRIKRNYCCFDINSLPSLEVSWG